MIRYKGTRYLVTIDGKIWSEISNKYLIPSKGKYSKVILWFDGRKNKRYIHRLIAECYLENPNNYEQVNHIDNNPENNNIENLEWCTSQMNIDHKVKQDRQSKGIDRPLVKLTEHQVLEIRSLVGKMSHKKIANIYCVSQALITGIINRKRWKHI